MESDVEGRLPRLLSRLKKRFDGGREADPDGWDLFELRLQANLQRLLDPLQTLYGNRDDFAQHLDAIVASAAQAWLERPIELRALDAEREGNRDWFQHQTVIGGALNVDLFANDFAGLRERLPYLEELEISYLQLVPPFTSPAGNNDGGYAVSSYRRTDPQLGSMADLAALAAELRERDISLALDFVINHTSDEHQWAIEARRAPDDESKNFYLMFPDREMPDAYDASLRELFPEQREGCFTWVADVGAEGRWVWTTYQSMEWDLNFSNPHVFRKIAEEMLFLANQGIEILGLSAVPFCWKTMGTNCENLPETHELVRALNALASITAPALLLKSEATAPPASLRAYLAAEECPLADDVLASALIWETLATRKSELLRQSMRHWATIPDTTSWVNVVRTQDAIAWTFDDADASALGINSWDHRQFLNSFYTGAFEGSFARGLPFQPNPKTGECGISGTTASLSGLEKALREEGPDEVGLAIDRLLLLYGIAMTKGGIPLIYLGDELGTLNDYGFKHHPSRATDTRWVHRVAADEDKTSRRHDLETVEGRIFDGLQRLIQTRRGLPALAGCACEVIDTDNDRVFAFRRDAEEQTLLVLMNVTESPQSIYLSTPGAHWWSDELTGDQIGSEAELRMLPYQQRWLTPLPESPR